MASLPIILPSGQVLVYGLGFNTAEGFTTNLPNLVFGIVQQVYDGGQTYVYSNDLVMFDKNQITGVLYYAGQPYTQLPLTLVTKVEIPE